MAEGGAEACENLVGRENAAGKLVGLGRFLRATSELSPQRASPAGPLTPVYTLVGNMITVKFELFASSPFLSKIFYYKNYQI